MYVDPRNKERKEKIEAGVANGVWSWADKDSAGTEQLIDRQAMTKAAAIQRRRPLPAVSAV